MGEASKFVKKQSLSLESFFVLIAEGLEDDLAILKEAGEGGKVRLGWYPTEADAADADGFHRRSFSVDGFYFGDKLGSQMAAVGDGGGYGEFVDGSGACENDGDPRI